MKKALAILMLVAGCAAPQRIPTVVSQIPKYDYPRANYDDMAIELTQKILHVQEPKLIGHCWFHCGVFKWNYTDGSGYTFQGSYFEQSGLVYSHRRDVAP